MTPSQIRRLQRKRTRHNYLIKLAASNPNHFDARWRALSESWVQEIQYRAPRLNDENGEAVSAACAVVDQALQLLRACGCATEERLKSDTEACLLAAYIRSMTQAVDKHLHRLGPTDTETS